MRGPFVLLVFVILLVCCAPTRPAARVEPGYVVAEDLALPAPALPPLCGPVPMSDYTWVLFTSQICPYCRALRQELAAATDELRQRGIVVVELLVDAGDCEAARQVARTAGAPSASAELGAVGLADPQTTRAWGVSRTPVVFLTRGKTAHALFVGQAPVAKLLAAHDRLPGQ